MAQPPSSWQQPPGLGGPVLQRPPPSGSAWQFDSVGPGVPPTARQSAVVAVEPQSGGCWVMISQQMGPDGSVVLVVLPPLVVVLVVLLVVLVLLDVLLVEVTVTVVTVTTVVLVVTTTQFPSGSQMASGTNAPPRLLQWTSFMSPPMAHAPSNWQQPPGFGGASVQRPPPSGSAWHTELTGPGMPPSARQSPAVGAEPHSGGSWFVSWQQTLPSGRDVLVVVLEIVDVVVEVVVLLAVQQAPVLL